MAGIRHIVDFISTHLLGFLARTLHRRKAGRLENPRLPGSLLDKAIVEIFEYLIHSTVPILKNK